VGDLLRREGLVRPRRRPRDRSAHPGRPRWTAEAPNDLWTADFKGQFRTRDRTWCYPLTVLDHVSRRCLALHGLLSTEGPGTQEVFEQAFRDCGLPLAILTDNGAPFASARGLHGLTKLSAWWIRLGIQRLRTEPASPEQNGAHERFHRTLKAETTEPAVAHRAAQQRRFNRFRTTYNEERPHEALGGATPASRWRPSPRPYPERLGPPEYPEHYLKRLVSPAGAVYFRWRVRYLSSALAGQWVGFQEVDDGVWSVHFCSQELTRWDERDMKRRPDV
jgi:putative transposase